MLAKTESETEFWFRKEFSVARFVDSGRAFTAVILDSIREKTKNLGGACPLSTLILINKRVSGNH